MSNENRDRKQELAHRVRAHEPPHPSRRRGFVVMLWLFALLIAEVEFWMLAFAHMYRM